MACLEYRPGEVLRLRSGKTEKSNAAAGSYGVGLARPEETVPLADGNAVDLIVGYPGEEQRIISALAQDPGTITMSLNFLGTGAASRAARWPRLPVEFDQYVLQSGDDEPRETPPGVYCSKAAKVLTIDPATDHCSDVMRSIAAGFSEHQVRLPAAERSSLDVLGICLRKDSADYIDLFAMIKLLAIAGRKSTGVYAVNLSVDFGVYCLGTDRAGGENPLPEEIGSAAYSFPVLEHVLAVTVSTLAESNMRAAASDAWAIPGVFAAAGNRDGPIRWRLGYPAVRPETIAVTFVTGGDHRQGSVQMQENADIPTDSSIHPCFALDADKVARTGSRIDGTSFACAWLAGQYTSMAIRDPDLAQSPSLGKKALLLAYTDRRPIGTTHPAWVVPNVHILNARKHPSPRSPLQTAMRQIGTEQSDAQFAATGSFAAVDAWLTAHEFRYRDVFESPRSPAQPCDVNVTFLGPISEEMARERAIKAIRAAMSDEFTMSAKADALVKKVEAHSVEGRISGTTLTQCIIPACEIQLTGWGWIDAWGGLSELSRGELSISIPTNVDVWDFNPQFAQGVGAAVGILIWANLILLLNVLAKTAREPKIGPRPAAESLSVVEQLITAASAGGGKGNLPHAREVLWGGNPAPNLRLKNRMTRQLFLRSHIDAVSGERLKDLVAMCARLESLAPK